MEPRTYGAYRRRENEDETPLTERDMVPNLNSVVLAGVVGRTSQTSTELRWPLRYTKRWLGGTETIVQIPCYSSGERANALKEWLIAGMTVVVRGELVID